METLTKVVNLYHEDYDVYIGRNPEIGDPKWGNPFKDSKIELEKRLAMYEMHVRMNLWDDLGELLGKRLGCTCKPKNCHGDVLVKLVNEKFSIDVENKKLKKFFKNKNENNN
jgi:hypothetical protein